MKNSQQTRFSWCPVCMVHTYHARKGAAWQCTNEDHDLYLRSRNDPWIKKYKEEQKVKIKAVAEVQ